MKRQIVCVIALVLGLVGATFAQDSLKSRSVQAVEEPAQIGGTHLVPPPVVTELQQTQFERAALLKENALLKAQQAGIAYQQASEAFDRLIAALQVAGYDLQVNKDNGKLEYVKKAAPAADKKDEPKKKDSPPK